LSKEVNADNESWPDDEEASAKDDKSNGPDPFNDWSTEGLDELDGSQIPCHLNAFYTLVKKYAKKEYISVLMTKSE
jgi:hypothetical protein